MMTHPLHLLLVSRMILLLLSPQALVRWWHPLGAGTRTTEIEEEVDNGDLTLDDNDDYSLSEKMVHFCGGHILQVR